MISDQTLALCKEHGIEVREAGDQVIVTDNSGLALDDEVSIILAPENAEAYLRMMVERTKPFDPAYEPE